MSDFQSHLQPLCCSRQLGRGHSKAERSHYKDKGKRRKKTGKPRDRRGNFSFRDSGKESECLKTAGNGLEELNEGAHRDKINTLGLL